MQDRLRDAKSKLLLLSFRQLRDVFLVEYHVFVRVEHHGVNGIGITVVNLYHAII